MDTVSIDDSPPLPVRRPAAVAELADLVKEARAAGHGVYPVGGRTTLDVGLPPLKPGIALDTTALNRVIDYPARDMTITAQAGITVAALQAELAREGQWLPVDVASPERATLGGAVALNQSGPRRYGYGTLRDYVIGISFVTDDGVEVKAGGRVVKNVAGYDLMKLQVGAVGTLGVVTQVTLKVKPKPEASAAVVFGCTDKLLGLVLDDLHASKTRPVAVELMDGDTWQACDPMPGFRPSWVVLVAFEEKESAVRWQAETLISELGSLPRTPPERTDIAHLNHLTQLQGRPESRFIGKLSVLPSQLPPRICELPTRSIHAHALNGIIWSHGESPPDGAVLRRCPVEMKRSLPVWGQPTPAWELMRHVKRTLDPDNVFNPGRLFGDV